MKQKKIIFLFLGIVSLVFSLNAINSTYAKYASKTTSKSEFNIAKWDIVVNDDHVKNNSTEFASITPNYIENNNVSSGVIAPGSIGYFDLTIDGSLTDVSFDFDIEVIPDETSLVSDIRIMKYYIDNVDNITDVLDEGKIKDSINITDQNKSKVVRIYVIWEEENGMMDNEADSTAGHNAEEGNANVKVKINFKQKLEI